MKKVWNAPDVQELTIQSTAQGYGGSHSGSHGGSHNGGNMGGGNGFGSNDRLCRCQGGTSPCASHHGFGDAEDELS